MSIRYQVVDADPLDIFLGVCKRCNRPRRETDTGYPLSTWADKHNGECDECHRPVPMERVYGAEIGMQCDDRCQGATRTSCDCACGGVNHGGIWSMKDNILAGALAQYRSTQAKRQETRERRVKDREADRLEAFRAWTQAEPQAFYVDYLRVYRNQRKDGTEEYPNPFLDSLVKWLSAHKPLTDNQLAQAKRTIDRRVYMAGKVQVKGAPQPAKAYLSNEGLTLGVFKWHGDIIVAKPNKAGTKSYANRVVPCTPRRTHAGTLVKYELEYAPGILTKLTEADRMPEAEVKEFLIEYGRCVVCGQGIKRARSIDVMMGKRCAAKLGVKW